MKINTTFDLTFNPIERGLESLQTPFKNHNNIKIYHIQTLKNNTSVETKSPSTETYVAYSYVLDQILN